MALSDFFQRLSEPPTNPHAPAIARTFDVADLYRGPIAEAPDGAAAAAVPLDEKLRLAYFWIVNTAIISPHTTSSTTTRRPRPSCSATARAG